jgi:hypothetical protein
MKVFKYVVRILSGVRIKKLNKVINDVHEKSNKNKIFIFFDMLVCAIRYGAGYNDYKIFEFYNLKHDKRKTYVTRVKNKKIIMISNDSKYSYIFDHKNEFNERFKKYLNRDVIDLTKCNIDDFKKFMNNKEIIFVKPNDGQSGIGIERLEKGKFKSINKMFEYIKEKNFGVAEEQITQHRSLAKIYPLSVNCLRFVTLVVNNKVYFPYVIFKTGDKGNYVDNTSRGGMFCPVDIKTGKISNVAQDYKLNYLERHPYTNFKFVGFQIPYFKEAMKMVKSAAKEVKEVKFIGWDVAITNKGPCIIEGNDYPSYDYWQVPGHTPNKIGLLPFYQKLFPKL